ncbi:alpha/beta-hydrolase [Dacryopinax primogenitus]|uniref:Alpha/beta-hydrolase n=1 Tax=Dacryopinax primogenitus (strain DJM 731) TaxID=1858805 RepID=M5G7B9_DACPD|nr:alpha/beta-hydrolase [Dacryopinax primogenitus]EJT99662.1 alpha/beta-hydrolase [Dacryopinax primogenitus]
MTPTVAPYGTWKSPLTADALTASSTTYTALAADPSTKQIYRLESRPSEGGRSVVVSSSLDDLTKEKDVFGSGWNARSGVHEYGGGALWAEQGIVFFSDYGSGRIYTVKDGQVEAFTPENKNFRYADFRPYPDNPNILVSVMEDHTKPAPADVVNTIVLLRPGEAPQPIATGADFYSSPRWSTDGKWLCWYQWMHPNMPWDGGLLKLAQVSSSQSNISIEETRTIAGVDGQVSIAEPTWISPTTLLFQSDVSGFWNPWSYDVTTGKVGPLLPEPIPQEFTAPQWTFGISNIAVLSPDIALIISVDQGIHRLNLLTLCPAPKYKRLDVPFVAMTQLYPISATQAIMLGATDTTPLSSILLTLVGEQVNYQTIQSPSIVDFPTELFSGAEAKTLRTPDGPVHILYYPPRNPEYVSPSGERPPALVSVHGGPTGAAQPGLNLGVQFFTSRGYAWIDVQYGGSTGYGKAYRDLLNGQWGIVDVRDSAACVSALADEGLIDRKRVGIRGRSSGGFTVLAALCDYSDIYTAGVSLFGISDLKALAGETHKFESRYGDKLLGGTVDETQEVLRDRSPINKAEDIKAPLLLLQGSIDPVVPPKQAELILRKVQERGGVVDMVVFDGEGHGWRKAETMKEAAERELNWYEQVWGLKP